MKIKLYKSLLKDKAFLNTLEQYRAGKINDELGRDFPSEIERKRRKEERGGGRKEMSLLLGESLLLPGLRWID